MNKLTLPQRNDCFIKSPVSIQLSSQIIEINSLKDRIVTVQHNIEQKLQESVCLFEPETCLAM